MNLHNTDKELHKALDPSWMQQALEGVLKKSIPGIVVDLCEVADVKYEIGKPALILYQVTMRDREVKTRWKQFVSLRFLSEKETIPYPLPLRGFVLNSPRSCLFLYPYDPVLTWLPQLCDDRLLLQKLQHHLAPEKIKVFSLDMKLLAYTPSMRATYLMTMKVKRRGELHSEKWTWISKTSAYKQPEQIYPHYVALWKAGQGRVPMPEPKGCLFDPPVTFQEKVEGIRLGAVVDRPDFRDLMENLGAILARFHRLKIPLVRTRTLENEIRSLDRWSGMLIHFCPDWKKRVESLRLKMATQLEKRFSSYAPIHADFHHTNILVDGKKLVLIDMDEVALGDPALDVGRFMSSLRIPSLRTFGSFEGLGSARETFLKSYLAKGVAKIEEIRLFESISLLTSAASCFRFQRPDWQKEADGLLKEAEAVFLSSKRAKISSFSPVPPPILSFEKRIVWATDETYLKTVLASLLLEKTETDLLCCRVKKVRQEGRHTQIIVQAEGIRQGQKERFTLGIILYKGKKIREQFRFLQQVYKEMKHRGHSSLFPYPWAFLSSIEAYVIELKKDPSLVSVGNCEAFAALGRSLAHFHALVPTEQEKGSYVLRLSDPLKRIRFGKTPYVSFPFKMKQGDPIEDVSQFIASFQKHASFKQELTHFVQSYVETAGLDVIPKGFKNFL